MFVMSVPFTPQFLNNASQFPAEKKLIAWKWNLFSGMSLWNNLFRGEGSFNLHTAEVIDTTASQKTSAHLFCIVWISMEKKKMQDWNSVRVHDLHLEVELKSMFHILQSERASQTDCLWHRSIFYLLQIVCNKDLKAMRCHGEWQSRGAPREEKGSEPTRGEEPLKRCG